MPPPTAPMLPLSDLVLGIRNELQSVIEALAQPSARTVSAGLRAEGFVQPDRVQITIPVAFGIASTVPPPTGADKGSVARVTVQIHGEANPPPATVQLGSIELQFVIAAKR